MRLCGILGKVREWNFFPSQFLIFHEISVSLKHFRAHVAFLLFITKTSMPIAFIRLFLAKAHVLW